jgi:hypothetical protein
MQVNDLVDTVSDEGEAAGKWAAFHALGRVPPGAVKLPVRRGEGIRYVTPQLVYPGEDAKLSLRVASPGQDKTLQVSCGNQILVQKTLKQVNPAEMILMDLPAQKSMNEGFEVSLI